MLADRNCRSALTNEKSVLDFVSDTKAYSSISKDKQSSRSEMWKDLAEMSVVIDGSKVTLTGDPGEQSATVFEFVITAISDTEFTANAKMIMMEDGVATRTFETVYRYVRVIEDYSNAILGTWEVRCTSEGSVFDDGVDNREWWEIIVDGDAMSWTAQRADVNGSTFTAAFEMTKVAE